MDPQDDLLKKAALFRRVASIKTTGSVSADRALLELAWEYERLAEVADQLTASDEKATPKH